MKNFFPIVLMISICQLLIGWLQTSWSACKEYFIHIYHILANDDIPMSNFGLVCLQAKQSIWTGDRIICCIYNYMFWWYSNFGPRRLRAKQPAWESNMLYNIWIGDDVPTLVQSSCEPSSLPGRIPFSEVLLTSQTLSQGTLSGSTSYRQQAQLEVFIRDIIQPF